MNKKILIFVIAIIVILAGLYLIFFKKFEETPLNPQEQLCIDLGGTVTTANCCKSASDFPNLCMIGPCGCAPEYSHEIKICDCDNGCWDGTKCTKTQIDTSGWQVYTNPKYAYTMKYPSDWTAKHEYGSNEILGTGYYESNVFTAPSGYALVFAVVPKNGDVMPVPRTGVGAGDFVDSDETMMVGDVEVGIKNLVFGGKIKELFINDFEINGYKGKAYISFFGEENYRDLDMTSAEEVKIIKAILESFQLTQSSRRDEFCGKSTNGQCSTDADCITGGCSGQVCQSKSEEPVITTCEYTDCYNAAAYNLTCGCVNKKCQWK